MPAKEKHQLPLSSQKQLQSRLCVSFQTPGKAAARYLLNPVQHLIHTDVVEVDQPRQLPVLDERAALWRREVFQESFQVLVVLVDNCIWREQELRTEAIPSPTAGTPTGSGNREAPVLQEGGAVQRESTALLPCLPRKSTTTGIQGELVWNCQALCANLLLQTQPDSFTGPTMPWNHGVTH